MLVTQASLDEFVSQADAAGGPDSPDVQKSWLEFRYQPSAPLDPSLDPDSEAYFAGMMSLYEELANRKFEPEITEFTDVDVARLVGLESPYSFASASHRALHYLRLSTAHHLGGADGGRALDMGCGWGLSSEFLAQLGYAVTAVDINQRFVDLVDLRARRLGYNITARQSAFERVVDEPESYDLALFYECLHHAVRPRDVLNLVSRLLKPGGVLLLAGEPVQQNWWQHWGLRLDALSVYCIRKFGWFESGWSADYLSKLVSDAGLVPILHQHPDSAVGCILVGHKIRNLTHRLLQAVATPEDWWFEGLLLISNRSGRLSRLRLMGKPPSRLTFKIHNHGAVPFDIVVDANGKQHKKRLEQGLNLVAVETGSAQPSHCDITFECDSWCPQEVLGNGDSRRLGFHLESLEFT